MKCFNFVSGRLEQGIALRNDVIFLGEEGRGRHYEKVALAHQNPAHVQNGRVMEAHARKMTLPTGDRGPEKSFFVLEQSGGEGGILVRINTDGGYIRGAYGNWKTMAGKPETLVSGYGAFGAAGNVGSWADGLALMRPGDVIRVHPTRSWGDGDSALWVDSHGELHSASWQDYETLTALAQAEATMAKAEAEPSSLNVLHGTMPALTWHGGKLENGLRLTKGATGLSVQMGESGRGRHLAEVPIVGDLEGEVVLQAAIAQLSEKVRGLVTGYAKTEQAFLVRVDTRGGYTRRGNGYWKPWKGQPVTVATGNGADGDAGGIGSWSDELLVLREGDVIYATPAGRSSLYSVFVKGGKVLTELWATWKIEDAKRDPEFYVAKGTAPWGHVPSDWIGKVVTVKELESSSDGNSLVERHTGELVSVSPLKLNLGWDNRDYSEVVVGSGAWIVLEKDKHVRRLEGAEAVKRQILREQAEALKALAVEVTSRSYFGLLEKDLRERISKVTDEQALATVPTEGYGGSLSDWVGSATRTLEDFAVVEAATLVLEQRQSAGELLIGFEAWHRRGGATNHGDGWVVRPDGSLRLHDSDDVRKYKSDGTLRWERIEPGELALKWNGHLFVEVAHTPVSGLTDAQFATVKTIEQEIGAPQGLFGFDKEITERSAKRLEAIHRVLKKRLGSLPETVSYEGKLAQTIREFFEYEVGINAGNADQGLMRKVNVAEEPQVPIDGRNAYVADTIPAADGVVELLAYHKYGGWNLGIRWRETGEVAVDDMPVATAQVTFTHHAKRDFRCSCGGFGSLTSSVFASYQAGQPQEVRCGKCGGTGVVKK